MRRLCRFTSGSSPFRQCTSSDRYSYSPESTGNQTDSCIKGDNREVKQLRLAMASRRCRYRYDIRNTHGRDQCPVIDLHIGLVVGARSHLSLHQPDSLRRVAKCSSPPLLGIQGVFRGVVNSPMARRALILLCLKHLCRSRGDILMQ